MSLRLAELNKSYLMATGKALQCAYCDYQIKAAESIITMEGLKVPPHFCPFILDMAGADEATPATVTPNAPAEISSASIVEKMQNDFVKFADFPPCEIGECIVTKENKSSGYCIKCNKFYCKYHESNHCG